MDLKEIKKQVCKCQRCELYKTKINYVFGNGNPNADIVFIGEAPGAMEDKEGVPFIGKAGKTLTGFLNFIGLKRKDIFILNVLKCRPPKNRNPLATEIKECTPFLTAQLEAINPKIICTLGNYSTKFMLNYFGLKHKIEGINKIHNKVFKIYGLNKETLLIPMFHPSVVSYSPYMKQVLLDDFKKLKSILEQMNIIKETVV